jgi:hypothetical protein
LELAGGLALLKVQQVPGVEQNKNNKTTVSVTSEHVFTCPQHLACHVSHGVGQVV